MLGELIQWAAFKSIKRNNKKKKNFKYLCPLHMPSNKRLAVAKCYLLSLPLFTPCAIYFLTSIAAITSCVDAAEDINRRKERKNK